jgi:predicted lipoprotein with Yx(FWY)xxD motif
MVKRFAQILLLSSIALILSSCNPLAALQDQEVTPTYAATMQMPNTGQNPSVTAQDQETDGKTVVVADVFSSGPGWMVIHAQTNNTIGEVVGFAPVKDGDNQNVTIALDPAKVTPVMYAMLHADSGQVGKYEYPGPDVPVMVSGQMVAPAFSTSGQPVAVVPPTQAPTVQPTMDMGSMNPTVESTTTQAAPVPTTPATGLTPSIKVADQAIRNGSIILPEVVSSGDSWVVIHRVNGDGSMGSMVGYALIHNGDNLNVVVPVDTSHTSNPLAAMLHEDHGVVGVLEFPGPDVPVMVNGQMITPLFNITNLSSADVVINLSDTDPSAAHLVNADGFTLYFSLQDKTGKSNCTGDCLTLWRPVFATGKIVTGSGVPAGKLGVIILDDGRRQVTYAGAPLYSYAKDNKAGDVNGNGLDGVWFVVTP